MVTRFMGVVSGLATLWLGASLLIFGMLAFDDEVATALSSISPENRIVVRELEYRDGLIYQRVEPLLGGVIEADWSAGIYVAANEAFVCSDHGTWQYGIKKQAIGFTPSDWTGADCPPLQGGVEYIARAKWDYYCDRDEGADRCTTYAEIRFKAGE